jgi:predicted transcriptional regulator
MSTTSNVLDSVRVGDCMRVGIFSCERDTPVREVAAMMSSLRIHAVAVRADPPAVPGLISDLELMAGIADGADRQAHEIASGTALTISRRRTLRDAAKLMAARGAAHLVVVNESSGRPVGVLSTTDILHVYAASARKQGQGVTSE